MIVSSFVSRFRVQLRIDPQPETRNSKPVTRNSFQEIKLNLQFTLNGKPWSVECEPADTLAEVLRNQLNLNGTKVSCEVQVCGACTVLVDNLPVSACTYPAYEARGKKLLTVEGLEKADGTLHPIQQAFIDEFAFQCGFCTPGMIMATKALLDEIPNPTREEIIHHMDGNICRCTGYLPIVAAIQRAAGMMSKESPK
jgi:aerobic-type carbon monoxide dehydrogenase small subunit (CoxS/CutS family)